MSQNDRAQETDYQQDELEIEEGHGEEILIDPNGPPILDQYQQNELGTNHGQSDGQFQTCNNQPARPRPIYMVCISIHSMHFVHSIFYSLYLFLWCFLLYLVKCSAL